MCFPKPRHDIRENPLSKVKAYWWIWTKLKYEIVYWTKDNEKQVSHKYYRLHEDRRRFELGLRFYRSSFSYLSVDRKTDINMQILKRGHNLLLRKTSICPPYWNANSKTLEPSLPQAPEGVDTAVIPLARIIFTSFQFLDWFLTFDWETVKTSNCVKRQNCCTVLHGRKTRDGASLPRKRSFIYSFIYLYIYLFHALLDKIKTEWNIQTW